MHLENDPGLMTLDEYLHTRNEGDVEHPSDSYTYTVADLNSDPSAYFFGTTLGDPSYEIMKHEGGYTLSLNGEIVGVSDGKALYLSHPIKDVRREYSASGKVKRVELGVATPVKYAADYLYKVFDAAAVNKEKYPVLIQQLGEYEVRAVAKPTKDKLVNLAVLHKGQVVAIAANEWGATLISVAKEYAGRKLGLLLDSYWTRFNPSNVSGGFTPAGKAHAKRMWSQRVHELLSQGEYSKLVASGDIALSRVNEILSQAGERILKPGDIPAPPKHVTRTGEVLVCNFEGIGFIAYDRAFLEEHDEDLIEGYGFMRSDSRVGSFFYRLDYTPKSKTLCNQVALQLARDNGTPIYVGPGYGDMVEADGLPVEKKGNYISLTRDVINLGQLFNREKATRKKIDPYDEVYDALVETAEGKEWSAATTRSAATHKHHVSYLLKK